MVLIAEDEPDIRELASLLLERAGHPTVAYEDGAAALEGAFEHQPALFLIDVMMPRMNGFELLRRLKADSRTAAIPVIICTATIQDERQVRDGGPQADAYLRKPFTRGELEGAVRMLLG